MSSSSTVDSAPATNRTMHRGHWSLVSQVTDQNHAGQTPPPRS